MGFPSGPLAKPICSGPLSSGSFMVGGTLQNLKDRTATIRGCRRKSDYRPHHASPLGRTNLWSIRNDDHLGSENRRQLVVRLHDLRQMGGVHDRYGNKKGDRMLFHDSLETVFPVLRPSHQQHERIKIQAGRTGLSRPMVKYAERLCCSLKIQRLVWHYAHRYGRTPHARYVESTEDYPWSRSEFQGFTCRLTP